MNITTNAKKSILLVALSFDDRYPPLGLANLKAYALKNKEINEKFDIFIESFPIASFKEESVLSLVEKINPEIIGFTLWSWCKNKVVRLCEKIKERAPGVTIILGGPEARREYLRKGNVDFLVYGRGELSFAGLVENNIRGHGLKDIPSISFKKNGRISDTKQASLEDINEIPSAYLNNLIDLKRYSSPILQTEYGCTLSNCYYCDIQKKDRRKQFYSLDRVQKEISFILERSGYLEIINCNLNFLRERFIQILEFIRMKSSENTKLVLWLNHNFLAPGDADLISSIKGEKILEFELYVEKGRSVRSAAANEFIKFSKALAFFRDKSTVCCLRIMLDKPFKNSRKDMRLMHECLKNISKQRDSGLFTYTALTGKNFYDRA